MLQTSAYSHCHAIEAIQRVPLHCPRYDTPRLNLAHTFRFKPPDDFLLDL
jgi:hypothetical protein